MPSVPATTAAAAITNFGGQFENQQRATARLKIIIPISVFLIFVLLFAFVFGGAIPIPGDAGAMAYRNYLMPGICSTYCK